MAFHNVPPNGFPDIPDIEDLEAVQGDIATLKTGKAPKTDIAANFSATANYAVGDLVYKDGVLYECINAHEAAAWAAGDFTAASVGSAISGVNSNLLSLDADIDAPNKKNFLQNNATSTTQPSGITYTVYDDGSVKVEGEATDNSNFTLNYPFTREGNYILSGCPSGGSTTGYSLEAFLSSSKYVKDTGNGVNLTIGSSESWRIRITVASGTVIPDGGITFYPMLRLATITDATFAPYIPSVETRLEAVESARFRVLANSAKTGTHSAKLDELTATYDTLTNMERMHAIIHFNSYILPIADIYNKRFASTAKYVSEDKLVSYHVQLGTTGSTLFKAVTTTTGTTFTDMSTETDANLSIQLLI